ncbi:MAG: hypothetical protein MJ141_05845 [Clostridia bacterium]|nr:hypothetical protein [Clostridia bacterium]
MVTSAFIGLKNERLMVEIAKPGTVYAGSRFDWTGFITQVYLDKKHTFCAYEDVVPGLGSGGIGFCNDFGLNTPIGYDEAAVGEGYMKIGIGTVIKQEGHKGGTHMLAMRIAENAEITYRYGETFAEFKAVNPEINGYKAELEKKITIEDNTMTIDYKLSNTGSKHISTEEYIHNFVCVDGQYVGPNYKVEVAFKPDEKMLEMSKARQPEFEYKDGVITFNKTFEGRAFYAKGFEVKECGGAHWKLTEANSGCSVSETDSFAAPYMACWGTKYVFSPEAFIQIELDPGEEMTWSRSYKFED